MKNKSNCKLLVFCFWCQQARLQLILGYMQVCGVHAPIFLCTHVTIIKVMVLCWIGCVKKDLDKELAHLSRYHFVHHCMLPFVNNICTDRFNVFFLLKISFWKSSLKMGSQCLFQPELLQLRQKQTKIMQCRNLPLCILCFSLKGPNCADGWRLANIPASCFSPSLPLLPLYHRSWTEVMSENEIMWGRHNFSSKIK